jgi:hypothetical protein
MTSSYETCERNATQDKRKGRRAAMTAFDDWEKIANRTGQLLQAGPPQTGIADDGVHGWEDSIDG